MGARDREATASRPAEPASEADQITWILPSSGWQLLNLHELWRYRELLGILTWRDVSVRYKQTILGAAWAILQPALMMAIFTIVFGRMARVSSGGAPYPLFAYTGLVAWTFFASAIANAGTSIVASGTLVSKIYFPRLAIPLAAVGASAVDFIVSLGLLAALMIGYGVVPGPGLLLVPLIFGLIALAAVGVGTLLAALNVAYRDFKYVIPFLVQIWMFATPSIYMQVPDASTPAPALASEESAAAATTAALASEEADQPTTGTGAMRLLLVLNPLTSLIANFRAAALGTPIDWPGLGVSSGLVTLVLLVGCFYFRKVEDQFADII